MTLKHLLSKTDAIPSLFAYPAEDNFAGVKYPLEWIELCHHKKLLDNILPCEKVLHILYKRRETGRCY